MPTILLACVGQASGQSAISEWQGVVRNGNGTPVSGAIVRLAGGSKAEAKTGIDGRFKLPPLPVGKYHLTIETDQHKVDYAARMELSAVSTAVTITLSADYQITVAIPNEQSGATGGEELSSKQVSQLPLNKRLQPVAVTRCGHHDRRQWRYEFYSAVRHQRTTWRGSYVCHGWRRHQRSGNGRVNFF